MRVEIKHHYGWTAHDVEADSLPDAAYVAIRQTHAGVLTDDNHRREAGSSEHPGERGSIVFVRLRDATPLACPQLRRMADFWGGNRAGDYWFSVSWRRWYPHRTLAVDGRGRRWAMVRLGSGYARWECLTDPRLGTWDHPGPAPGRACCGDPNTAEGRTCEAHGGPWVIGGEATDAELRRADAVRLRTHDLIVLSDVEGGTCTPTRAAARLKLGRGQAGRDALARRTRHLLEDLLDAEAGRAPGERTADASTEPFDAARRRVLELTGVLDRP